MANTGYLDRDGIDLINAYCKNSTSTFTGSNIFNYGSTSGIISYNQAIFTAASTVTYTSSNIPNCILSKGGDAAITFNLPTTGVPNGFMLHFRRNNGGSNPTYSFTPNIRDLSNNSVSSFNPILYSFTLIHYNTIWYIYFIR